MAGRNGDDEVIYMYLVELVTDRSGSGTIRSTLVLVEV
jgi:hypothetical protein